MAAAANPVSRVRITDHFVQNLKLIRAFKDNSQRINGMDWDSEGEVLITSGDDEIINIYSASKGECTRTLHSRKLGVDLIKFMHKKSRICICAARAGRENRRDGLRLWDLVEGRYLHYYRLPAKIVRGTGLAVHPTKPLMLAGTQDNCVRLFATQQELPLMTYQGAFNKPFGMFDSSGLIFALCMSPGRLHLYDTRKYTKSEFYIVDVNAYLKCPEEEIISCTFRPHSELMMLQTNWGRFLDVSSYNGTVSGEILPAENQTRPIPKDNYCFPGFSPDGRYLFCGTQENVVAIYSIKGGIHRASTLRKHAGPVRFCAFNPKKALLASAALNLAWWTGEVA